ncbi:MAG: cystathionine beta-lyase [Deltaproteobacteria bacterium SG8_13]|nr:MAG: cystathionine beta-lyase [Deltaproteobacteria bacterium SG8_13]
MSKNTQCVHSGSIADGLTGGLNSPIFTSSSFRYVDMAENVYPRYFNTPNQTAVSDKLRALENTEAGLLFSSGMAAISAVVFGLASGGDHVVMQRDIYGGTHHFATAEFERFGIEFTFVGSEVKEFEKALRDNTRLVYIETPSNPLLRVTDIAAVAQLAASKGICTAIDNTFASPINQNPHELGIDVVIHSGTKYLGGHSDICCGAVLTTRDIMERIKASAVNFGGSLNAVTCYLLERSLKTLGIRVDTQNRNAMALARHLHGHPRITTVYYPGLETHPGFEIASKQMRGFGGMLSFELDESKIPPDRFVRNLKLITPALSLGGVETIVCAPALTSHVKVSAEDRRQMGISDGLFRLSVGIEDTDDLVADLDQALYG